MKTSLFPAPWAPYLDGELKKEYMKNLLAFLEKEIKSKRKIAPKGSEFFRSLKEVPYDKVKVVILGQDPYPTLGHANGLAFAVNEGVDRPASLRNIYKEIASDLKVSEPESNTLLGWADQGVLLLNTTLTVRIGEPGSHRGFGWEQLTDRIIKSLNEREEPIIFLLWGNHAQEKRRLISSPQHQVLLAAHPSPLSAYRGFLGCKHFSKVNKILEERDEEVIDWTKTGR